MEVTEVMVWNDQYGWIQRDSTGPQEKLMAARSVGKATTRAINSLHVRSFHLLSLETGDRLAEVAPYLYSPAYLRSSS